MNLASTAGSLLISSFAVKSLSGSEECKNYSVNALFAALSRFHGKQA